MCLGASFLPTDENCLTMLDEKLIAASVHLYISEFYAWLRICIMVVLISFLGKQDPVLRRYGSKVLSTALLERLYLLNSVGVSFFTGANYLIRSLISYNLKD